MCYDQDRNKCINKNGKKLPGISSELVDKIFTFLPPSFLFRHFTYLKVFQYLNYSPKFWNNCLFTKDLDIIQCKKILLNQFLFLHQIKNGNENSLIFNTYQTDMTHMRIHNGLIFTSSDDQTIKAFNMSGNLVRQFKGHSGGVWAFHIINDILVTGSTDKTARVWSIPEQSLLNTLKYHKSTVRVVKCIDRFIITGGRDNKVVVWADEMGDSGEAKRLGVITVSGDDTHRYFGSYSLLHVLEGHGHSVRCMDVSEKYLVTGSYDCTVKLWDFRKGKLLKNLVTHKNRVYAVKLYRNWVGSSGMDSEVCVTSLNDFSVVKHTLHSGMVVWLDFHGPYIVSSGSDGSVIKYNYIERKLVYAIRESSTIKSQKVNNGLLLVGTLNTVNLYCFATGKFIKTLFTAYIIVKIELYDNRIVVGYSDEGYYKVAVFSYK